MIDKAFSAGARLFGQRARLYISEDSAIIDHGASRETVQRSLHDQYNNRLFAVLRHRRNILMVDEIRSKGITEKPLRGTRKYADESQRQR